MKQVSVVIMKLLNFFRSPSASHGELYCNGIDQASRQCLGGSCIKYEDQFERDILKRILPHETNGETMSAEGDINNFLKLSSNTPEILLVDEIAQVDFALLIGLTVALTVFITVTVLSVKIIQQKGQSDGLYNIGSVGE